MGFCFCCFVLKTDISFSYYFIVFIPWGRSGAPLAIGGGGGRDERGGGGKEERGGGGGREERGGGGKEERGGGGGREERGDGLIREGGGGRLRGGGGGTERDGGPVREGGVAADMFNADAPLALIQLINQLIYCLINCFFIIHLLVYSCALTSDIRFSPSSLSWNMK